MTSKRPGATTAATKIAQRVVDSFKREGVVGLLDDAAASKELRDAGFSDPKSCQGARACLSKLAILLGPKAVVVGVDVGKVGKTLAIHLEAVAADKDTSLATLDVSSSMDGWSDAMSAPIVVFVRDVKAGLELGKKKDVVAASPPPPPPAEVAPTSDAPTRTDLTPAASASESPVIVSQEPGKPPRVAGWVLAGGAAVAAGAAVGLGIMGGNARSQWDAALVPLPDGTQGTALSRPDAERVAGEANAGTVGAITAGVVSAGLTAAATYFFLKE